LAIVYLLYLTMALCIIF